MNEIMYKTLREKPEEIPLTTSVHVLPPESAITPTSAFNPTRKTVFPAYRTRLDIHEKLPSSP
jgi:hypothetical protein